MAKQKGKCEQAQQEWRPLYGFETTARIAKDGTVETLDRVVIDCRGKEKRINGKVLTSRKSGGSLVTNFNRRQIIVGKAVAESWIRPIAADERVVYVDGNPSNATLNNVKIVKRSEARQYMHNRTRASQNRKRKIQRKGELWRPVPDFELQSLSNFGRIKSRAMQPETLLKVVARPRSPGVVWLHKNGKTFARSIASLMRQVWPELADEYPYSHEIRRRNSIGRRKVASETVAKRGEKRGEKGPKNRGKMASKSG